MKLKGKTAVVTGASRGIGKAVALSLAKEGVNVILAARSAGELDKVCKEIEKTGAKAVPVKTDISSEKDVAALAKKAAAFPGRVDFLINCAGQFLQKKFFETTVEDWDEIIGTNLKGTYLCIREIGKLMRDGQGGVIINFSSVGGRIGLKDKAIYCASKFGIAGMTKALAKELKEDKIKLHTIYPYMVDSKDEVDWSKENEILNVLKTNDVADLILYLLNLPLRVEIEDIYLDTFKKGS
ncbi:SDR family NAD(P)-dependent oxidoreductase [Candidatus Auribacterota bacterium]